MSGLLLLRPWWLLGLLPVTALALWLWRHRAAGDWALVVDPALLAAMRRLGHLRAGGADLSPFAACAAAGLVVLALAGPALRREGATTFDRLDPIILLLDLSPSVAAGPALADLQAAAARILQIGNGRPIGIMVYAADAYVASAPTSDAASLESIIAVLSPETMPVGGSRPDIALAVAREVFTGPDTPGPAGADIIVISDGGAADRALDEATRLREDGARVWTLELTAPVEGAPLPNPAALRDLARAGGGVSAPARSPEPILAAIDQARISRIARSDAAMQVFRDLGPFLLGAALLPALALFRRRL